MATLHTVNRSPHAAPALASCLRVALPGHGILLIEDGVYAAVAASDDAPALRAAPPAIALYALGADLAARGIAASTLLDAVQVVDYEGFVDLACRYDKVLSWS
jgi:tRNA 2-thiouridine synthesizing protein B